MAQNLYFVGLVGLVASTACFSPDSGLGQDNDGLTTTGIDSNTDGSTTGTESAETHAPSSSGQDEATTTPATESGVATATGPTATGSGGDTTAGSTSGAAAPTIVEVTPANDATGIFDDTTILVQFSEPMDAASTQAAYQSADIPAAMVTFAWNAARDELTIAPNVPLEYAEGSNPAETAPLEYSFTLTTAAESEQGLGLATPATFSFATLRRLSASFEDDPMLSGRVRDLGGATLIGGSYVVGDTNSNDVGRGFVSFDVSSLAAGPKIVESATFYARWSQTVGNPFIDLGAVVYQHVAYDTFDAALFDVPGIGSAQGIFATVAETEATEDVAAIVETVLGDDATYQSRVQFRMRWVFSESDNDGQSDGIVLIASDSALTLTYLAP